MESGTAPWQAAKMTHNVLGHVILPCFKASLTFPLSHLAFSWFRFPEAFSSCFRLFVQSSYARIGTLKRVAEHSEPKRNKHPSHPLTTTTPPSLSSKLALHTPLFQFSHQVTRLAVWRTPAQTFRAILPHALILPLFDPLSLLRYDACDSLYFGHHQPRTMPSEAPVTSAALVTFSEFSCWI